MKTQAKKLRELFNKREHFIAADAYSALTGRIVERAGFKCAYLGGHACSAFHYALPDIGIFSQIEQIDQATRIVQAIDIPLIVDADTLGETIADAFHLVRRHERAGIAGIHVEDEVNPKHASLVNGLLPIPDMQGKLEACVKARHDPDFMIIARCDELYLNTRGGGGNGSMQEAIKRGRAYVEAGADALCFPLAMPDAHAELIKAINVPFVVLGPPAPGTTCTLHTGWGWTGAARLHIDRARELFETGTIKGMEPGFEAKDSLIQQDLYNELIADWAKKTGRQVR